MSWILWILIIILVIIEILNFGCLLAVWSLRKDIDDVFKKLEFDEKDIAKPE